MITTRSRGHPQFGPDPRPRRRIGAEDGGVAAVADRFGVGGDVQAARVAGLGFRDGQEHVGHPGGDPLHDEGQAAAGQRGRCVVEQEAVAGIGDLRHAGDAGGQARQEAADRHMGVDEVGLFGAQDGHQRPERPEMRQRRQAADEGDRDDAEPLGPDVRQQRTFGAGADDFVPAGAHGAHQRQQEVPQGKIDVGDFDDFHRRMAIGRWKQQSPWAVAAPWNHDQGLARAPTLRYPTNKLGSLAQPG